MEKFPFGGFFYFESIRPTFFGNTLSIKREPKLHFLHILTVKECVRFSKEVYHEYKAR